MNIILEQQEEKTIISQESQDLEKSKSECAFHLKFSSRLSNLPVFSFSCLFPSLTTNRERQKWMEKILYICGFKFILWWWNGTVPYPNMEFVVVAFLSSVVHAAFPYGMTRITFPIRFSSLSAFLMIQLSESNCLESIPAFSFFSFNEYNEVTLSIFSYLLLGWNTFPLVKVLWIQACFTWLSNTNYNNRICVLWKTAYKHRWSVTFWMRFRLRICKCGIILGSYHHFNFRIFEH